MAAQRPHREAAQARDVVDLTNALNEPKITVENRVVNTVVNAILDVANNTAALIQDTFGANAGAGRRVVADIPIQDRIPKPRRTILNNHVMTLIQEQVPQHEMNYDLFLGTINDVMLVVCRGLAAINPRQALAT